MQEKHKNEIKGIVIFALGILLFLSLISYQPSDLSFYTSDPNIQTKNFIGIFGAYLAGILFFLFGWTTYCFPVFIFLGAMQLFKEGKIATRWTQIIGSIILSLSASGFLALLAKDETTRFSHGGFLGLAISDYLISYIAKRGAFIVLLALIFSALVLVNEFLLSHLISNLIEKIKNKISGIEFPIPRLTRKKKEKPAMTLAGLEKLNKKEEFARPLKIKEEDKDLTQEEKTYLATPRIEIRAKQNQEQVARPKIPAIKIGDYQLPSLDLLESPPSLAARQIKEDLASNAKILEETLADFGISAHVTDIERGPVITRYELEPAPGVKVQKIASLSDDIALTMKAQSVRIVAPIPGKARVGVEVPNIQSSLVYLKEVLATSEFQNTKSKLTLALGKDIAGKPVITDLADMPHLLIAGTTGSGKTVCVNSLIMSMLYRSTPNEIKFLMIDPKMVEMAPFNGLPHLICPVVTDYKKVSAALNWVVNEMEERYQLLAKASTRNIELYNQKEEPLPYIIVIVDELADLMAVAANHIENAITRLAQLSRAVGIHLILATQRPSVDVITGVIKANFPARISFKVSSKVDSRTVLDANGADKLLGRGDLLFMRPGESKLIRAQGTLVQDKEIERVVSFIKKQAEPVYEEEILKEKQNAFTLNGEKDELFDEAVKLILESNQASVSILQRRMRLGYTRAARLIDAMEQENIIGPFEGSKPRKILVDKEAWLKEKDKGETNANIGS